MPQLLKLLDIKGGVVTADALNCQKDIAQQIIDQGGDYVLSLKGNHQDLLEDVKLLFESAISDGFDTKYCSIEHSDCGHGVSRPEDTIQFLWRGWTG